MSQRITQEEFMEKVMNSHSDTNYDYSLTVYTRAHDRVIVKCPKHGEFRPYAYELMNGRICPVCLKEMHKKVKHRGFSTEDFINKAREIHGDKYDYSKVEYVNNITPVCIICPEHGEFWQTPNKHLSKRGCASCGAKRRTEKQIRTNKKFISQLKEIFGDKYDYSKVTYVKAKVPVTIICPKHGEFIARPDHLLDGHGCPKCRGSILELTVIQKLRELKIKYIYEYRDKEIFGKQSLDFYLPDYNIAIECQGEQHFNDTYFKVKNIEDTKKQLNYVQELDKKKKQLCKENNIKLIYFLEKKFVKYLEDDDIYFTDINKILEIVKEHGIYKI